MADRLQRNHLDCIFRANEMVKGTDIRMGGLVDGYLPKVDITFSKSDVSFCNTVIKKRPNAICKNKHVTLANGEAK